MKSVYVITMWSGGTAAKKWKTGEKPALLPSGYGISFVCANTRLRVELIGNISVEEYESGKEELEAGSWRNEGAPQADPPKEKQPIKPLF